MSNGETTTASWDANCCGKERDTDAQGITHTYAYDARKRLLYKARIGANGAPDIVTTYTYDAAGRQLTETIAAGQEEPLRNRNVYDTAGRLIRRIDQQQLETQTIHDTGGRRTTQILPGGATRVTERYLNGHTKSETGTASVAQQHTYGINPDGTTWTRIHTGPQGTNSPRWQKSTTDLFGRTIRTEAPAFGGGVHITQSHYDARSRLVKTTATDRPATLYHYNDLNQQTATGLDVDNDDQLTPASMDRIDEQETCFEKTGDTWWQVGRSYEYPADNAATRLKTSEQRRRLTGFEPGMIDEHVVLDIRGNPTITHVYVDRASGTVTNAVLHPDSDIAALTVMVNGLRTMTRTKDGLVHRYGYDALNRQTTVTDPRTGETRMHYNSLGQVVSRQDALTNRTTYAYDPLTGRRTHTINALGHAVVEQFNAQGQVTNRMGEADYPVAFAYNPYGQMTRMRTWHKDDPTGDDTIWHYDEATGLLTNKLDAAGAGPVYTYTTSGQLSGRLWARGELTEYQYNSLGEMTNVIYNGNSATAISYTYDRLGRQKHVADTLTSRSFAYDPQTLALEKEAITGLYAKTMVRKRDAFGRTTGYALKDAAETQTLAETTYGYTAQGRFASVDWSVAGQTGPRFTYHYLADSPLIEKLTSANGFETTYEYEAGRNNKTAVNNTMTGLSGGLISRYAYRYDEINRRTSVENSGAAFMVQAFNRYVYNPRNEVTGADRFEGTLQNSGNLVLDQSYGYSYDATGNRIAYSNAHMLAESYEANDLNQYASITRAGMPDQILHYDLDGNLTDDGSWRMTWNAENRLVAMEPKSSPRIVGQKKYTFDYDFMGRRIRKSVLIWNGSAYATEYTSTFLYDNWNMIREERDNAVGDDRITQYTHGLDLSGTLQGAGGIGGILTTSSEGTTNYFCYDANGNVGQLVDGSGAINAHYEYSPFGKTIMASGCIATDNPYRFSTKYTDETDLVYYGYRYYSPELGRWLSRDPIGEVGGINLYGFVGNQAINQYDLVGMSGITWAGLAAIIEEVAATWIAVDPPCWLVMWLTPKYLPDGLPRQLWDRAANGGGDLTLTIDENNQGNWDNVVDKIGGSDQYDSAVEDIKKMICDDDIASKDEAVLINFKKGNDAALSFGLGRAWSNYKHDESTCTLGLWITDTYNFDKKHMWKKCQDKGKLTPFKITITMPDEDFCCCEEEE